MKQLMKTRCPDCQAWYWCGKACEHRGKPNILFRPFKPDVDTAQLEQDAAARTAELEAKHKEWREGQEQI